MSLAFSTPLPFAAKSLQPTCSKSPARVRRRFVPQARTRRGHTPDPVIPESLYAVDPIFDIDVKPFDFSKLKDKVVLVSNVASSDTHTESNYNLFTKLIKMYHNDGLEIVVFPSNWYGQKETGTMQEIKEFVHSKYSDKIIVMNKTDIEWNQVFALGRRYYPGEVIWNFHGKFLFNRQGLPVHRFDLLSTDEYVEDQVRAQINDGYTTPLLPDENEMNSMEEELAMS